MEENTLIMVRKKKVRKKLAKKLRKLKKFRHDNMSMDDFDESKQPLTSLSMVSGVLSVNIRM